MTDKHEKLLDIDRALAPPFAFNGASNSPSYKQTITEFEDRERVASEWAELAYRELIEQAARSARLEPDWRAAGTFLPGSHSLCRAASRYAAVAKLYSEVRWFAGWLREHPPKAF